jgi:hypothetical protein
MMYEPVSHEDMPAVGFIQRLPDDRFCSAICSKNLDPNMMRNL